MVTRLKLKHESFWGNMKVLLGYLGWGLGNNGPHSKHSVTGSCTIWLVKYFGTQRKCIYMYLKVFLIHPILFII